MLAYSIIFSIIKAYSHILRHIQAYSVIFSTLCNPHIFATLPLFWALAYLAFKTNLKAYSRGLFKTETLTKDIQKALFSHIQAFPEPWATLAYAETWHTQNPRIFRTLQLHPRVCSEPCHIYKNLWIFRTLTYFKTWHIHKPLKDLRWSFLKEKKKKKKKSQICLSLSKYSLDTCRVTLHCVLWDTYSDPCLLLKIQTFGHVQGLLRHIQQYCGISRTLCNSCIFRTLPYSESWHI